MKKYYIIFSIRFIGLLYLRIVTNTEVLNTQVDIDRIYNVAKNIFNIALSHGASKDENESERQKANEILEKMTTNFEKEKSITEFIEMASVFFSYDKAFNALFDKNSNLVEQEKLLYYLIFHDKEYVDKFSEVFLYLKRDSRKIKDDIKNFGTINSNNKESYTGLDMLLDKITKSYASRLRFFKTILTDKKDIQVLIEENSEKISQVLFKELVGLIFDELEADKNRDVFENMLERYEDGNIKKSVKLYDTFYYTNMEKLNNYLAEKYKTILKDPIINKVINEINDEQFEYTMIANLIALGKFNKIYIFNKSTNFDEINPKNDMYLYKYITDVFKLIDLPIPVYDNINKLELAIVITISTVCILFILRYVYLAIKRRNKNYKNRSPDDINV